MVKFMNRRTAMDPMISVLESTSGKVYTISINRHIGGAEFYTQVLSVLSTATKDDQVKIVINSVGGSVNTGLMIVTGMLRCKAHITTVNVGVAYSCGAMIWAYGDTVIMGSSARLMYHCTSHGGQGKTRNMKELSDAIEERILDAYVPIRDRGLITEDEMELIMTGKRDLFLNYTDMQERIANVKEVKYAE